MLSAQEARLYLVRVVDVVARLSTVSVVELRHCLTFILLALSYLYSAGAVGVVAHQAGSGYGW